MNEAIRNTDSRNTPRELGACPICGGNVVQKDIPRTGKCRICGKDFKTYHYCENGCDFCDICYGSFAFSNIASIINTKSKNPIDIINQMMSDDSFGLRGCIHCAATPLALVLAYRNIADISRKSHDLLMELFKTEVERTPISLCKETGKCGTPISCGNALSNLLPVIDSKYQNLTVGKRLKNECLSATEDVIDKNPCCKRITYIEIITVVDFVYRYMRVRFEMPEVVKCYFSEGNPYCDKENCQFYKGYRPNI